MAVEGTFDAWRRGERPHVGRPVAGRVAPAIPAAGLLAHGPDAALDDLRRRIDLMRLDLRAELRRRSGDRWPAPGPADEPSPTDEQDINRRRVRTAAVGE